MRKFTALLMVCMAIVLLLSLFSLPAYGIDTTVNRQVATPSASPTLGSTSEPTVAAPFMDADTPYVLIEGQSGSIAHNVDDGFVAIEETNLVAVDFAAVARFHNPYSTSEGSWDYGFSFRDNANGRYFIVVTSNSQWSFYYFLGDSTQQFSLSGDIDNLDTSSNGSNVLRLVVVGEKAYLAVNDVEVAVVDVSANMAIGEINIVGAFFTGNEIDGESTDYEDLTIWTVGLVPTFTPTALPETGLVATKGENHGELQVGSGQVWSYEGRAGEILTIEVRAENPFSVDGEIDRNGLDTLLLVRAPDGTLLIEADDIESAITTDTIVEDLVLPQDGTYQLEVRSWDNRSGGEYTLIIDSTLTLEMNATATEVRPSITPIATYRPTPTPSSGDAGAPPAATYRPTLTPAP